MPLFRFPRLEAVSARSALARLGATVLLAPLNCSAMDDATTPPPGLYYLGYLYNYRSSDIRPPASGTSLPGCYRAENNTLINRLMWISHHRLLGADYGMEILAPMVRNSLQMNAYGLDMHDSGGSISMSVP